MAIKKIQLENFTVFEKLDIEFGKGINVFIANDISFFHVKLLKKF